MAAFAIVLSSHAMADDFAIIKDRVIAELMNVPVEDERVEEILLQVSEDGSFNNIDYTDLSRTAGFPQRNHTANLVELARAYKNDESRFHGNRELKDVIIAGYRYWVDNDFFGDNWHNNQISTPTNLVDLMLLMGDELPSDLVERGQPIIGRAHMNASGARPSGDRIVIAGILAKNLLFKGDKERFDEIIRLIEGEVKFSTGSRGMQHDYSFHHRHDRVNNTTSYGYTKYANVFGEWSYYVAGTDYAFSVERINHLVDYYLDGIFKQQVYAIYPDISVKNRSITHEATLEPRPTLEIERLLHGTDYRRDELEHVIRLRTGEAKPSRSFAKFFWQTEHFVFQRPNFYTTVRMFSKRNRNMEIPYNGPGKPTHHRADGTNYLQLKGDEYHNIWPVYDWQKISGATIVQKPALHPPSKIQKDGLTDFVGAVTDGLIGAVAFDFISPHDFVEAKKAWFFFDEEYVCLGTGITCEQDLPVATTINQVLMQSEVAVSQRGKVKTLTEGNRELEQVEWVHQDGIGYIFPQPTTVRVSNRTETGRWSDITDQKNISDALVAKKVFMLWFDHGKSPQDASYAYIVAPNVTVSELDEGAKVARNVEILANTPQFQAVEHTGLGIAQMAFYEAGEVAMSNGAEIKMDGPGMVLIKMHDGRIQELSVSDPTRKRDVITLTIPGIHDASGEAFRFAPDRTSNSTTIVATLPKGVYAGKSVSCKF